MKRIDYFNKCIKDGIDFTIKTDKEGKFIVRELTDDDYELIPQTIQIENSQLDYYLNIINASYGQYGEPTVTDISVTDSPTLEERLVSMESMLTILMGV